jgi:metacaspase-1
VRSGCKDDQTSGDVGNVSSFQLPANVGPGGAGGACTNSMMRKLYPHDDDPGCPEADISYADLLLSMREFLEEKGYTQVPQLSSSYQVNLGEKFCVKPPGTQRTKALLIGINYVGHSVGVLSGCHNDVHMMKQFITSQGFSDSPNDMRILMDDGANQMPTRQTLEDAMLWLVTDARPGDAFFVHYSGHGSQTRDASGDEKSGKDQTMVPVDYQQAGQIIDDWIFQTLVQPLPKGTTMFCVMDCCHSGSIMDLPYEIVITPRAGRVHKPDAARDLRPRRKPRLFCQVFQTRKLCGKSRGGRRGRSCGWDAWRTCWHAPRRLFGSLCRRVLLPGGF